VLLNVEDELISQDLVDIGQSAADIMGTENGLYFADEDITYYSSCNIACTVDEVEAGQLVYAIETDEKEDKYLQVKSLFVQEGHTYYLITEKEVTGLFTDADNLRSRCEKFYGIILGIAAVLLLFLSWTMTRPLGELRKTTRKFATGDYSVRAKSKTRDEVGELAKSFNHMAQTIENKIGELEDAARRQEDFTANFAHELKTPMTSIIGYADTLYQKNLPPEEVHQLAGIIMNEGMRLEALSFKLLELVTLERTDFPLEEARIDEVLYDAVETALPSAQKRKITLTCKAEEAWVRLEHDLFKTLLLNLLDNALKSGTLGIQMTGECEGEDYRITIADQGRGIPEEELQRITEAFYMVDKSRSRKEHGAGLGLALAAKIADIHGTKLYYESQPGQGTRVSFTLRREMENEED
jgi:signal transduction histidine kinase